MPYRKLSWIDDRTFDCTMIWNWVWLYQTNSCTIHKSNVKFNLYQKCYAPQWYTHCDPLIKFFHNGFVKRESELMYFVLICQPKTTNTHLRFLSLFLLFICDYLLLLFFRHFSKCSALLIYLTQFPKCVTKSSCNTSSRAYKITNEKKNAALKHWSMFRGFAARALDIHWLHRANDHNYLIVMENCKHNISAYTQTHTHPNTIGSHFYTNHSKQLYKIIMPPMRLQL